MLVGCRLRTAVEAVGVADPVSVPHRHTAPLVAVLVLVDMLVGDAQHVQAEPGGTGAAGTGGRVQHKNGKRKSPFSCVGRKTGFADC